MFSVSKVGSKVFDFPVVINFLITLSRLLRLDKTVLQPLSDTFVRGLIISKSDKVEHQFKTLVIQEI